MVIWFIGLSGAGKSTLAMDLQTRIRADGKKCVLVDGDLVREMFDNDLSHSLEDRRKNADRICKLCKFLDDQGVNVVCAVLSIFHESQDWNRVNIKNYFEVFVDAELDTVKERDTKGIYKKALSGNTTNVVGVDIPFLPPKSPDLVINNDFTKDVRELTDLVFNKVKTRLIY